MSAPVLVIDIGSRSSRVLAVRAGEVVAMSKLAIDTTVPTDAPTGRAWDMSELWTTICAGLREVCDETAPEAVVSTSQRLGYVFCDAELEPRYGGPNADARGFLQGVELAREHGKDLARISGRKSPVVLVPARWTWFREARPEVVEATRWIMPLSDWIAARLTGIAGAEPSNAADTGLLDIATREWSKQICDIAEIDFDLLPPLRSPGDRLGEVTASAAAQTGVPAGTPVAVGGSDTACGLAGMGAVEPGAAATVAGSTSPLDVVTDVPVFDPTGRLWVNCMLADDRWAVDASTGECGIALTWLKTIMGIESSAAFDTLAGEADSSAGVMLHLTSPIDFGDLMLGETGQARFARPLIQLGPNRAQLARAFLENLAFGVKRALEWIDTLVGHHAFHLGGGFATSPVYPQVLADSLQEPLSVHDIHVTARGAANCALAAIGEEPSAPPAPGRVEPQSSLDPEYKAWTAELDRLEALAPRFSALLESD